MAQCVVELVSALPPEECEIRLRAAICRPGPFAWLDSRPVLGTAENRWVSFCKVAWPNNGFCTFLRGRLEPHLGGTVLRCRIGSHPFTRVLLGVFLGFGILVALIGVANALRVLTDGSPMRFNMLAPCLPLAFGLATWLHGRHLARGEDLFLITFAAEVLEAKSLEQTWEPSLALWHAPAQLRPNGERRDDQSEWLPSFPLVLMASAIVAMFVMCAGLLMLMVLFG